MCLEFVLVIVFVALNYLQKQTTREWFYGEKSLEISIHLVISRSLFPAAALGLKIIDIPIRYKDRTYGETNISRFSHGLMLLKMVIVGLIKIRCGKNKWPQINLIIQLELRN